MDYVNGTINFLSGFSGIFLSTIAIYNVLTFSCENQSKEYKKLLIFQFSGGFLSSLIQLVLKIQIFVIHDNVVVILDRFSNYLQNHILLKLLCSIRVYFIYFNISVPTIILISRYYYICTEKQITKIRFCYLILYAILCPVLVSTSNWFTFTSDIPKSLSQWIETNNIKYSIFEKKVYGISCKINSTKSLPAYFGVPIYFGLNYVLVFTHYIKYKKHMHKFTTVMSDITKKINKEFMRISILQCIVPLLISLFPVLYYIVSLLLLPNLFIATFGTHLIQILSLIPIINVTLFIFLPSKSRKKFISFTRKIKDKIICKNFTITKFI
uniref:G_PROTEIN_RECEP_F1_2 domain-containing protein n=1 Tax=Strongyloides papillosus TaxID=174720 RepID=A0A0N5C5A6_STREA